MAEEEIQVPPTVRIVDGVYAVPGYGLVYRAPSGWRGKPIHGALSDGIGWYAEVQPEKGKTKRAAVVELVKAFR